MNGNIRPDKNKKKDAIDGIVALLNAVYGYVTNNASAASKFMNALKTPD
jgi:phage terminase large subunit-like protein